MSRAATTTGPEDEPDTSVNQRDIEDTDETPYPWDFERDYPDELDDDDE